MARSKIHLLSEESPIVDHLVAELRDVDIQKDRQRFRNNIRRLGQIAAYEISRHLSYQERTIRTPLGTTKCKTLTQQPVVGSVMRAGIMLHHGFLDVFDKADNAFVGAYRREDGSSEIGIQLDYVGTANLAGRVLIFGDPMVATGGSLVAGLHALFRHGRPRALHLVAVVGSRAGIDRLAKEFPKAEIWVAAIDPKLNKKAYIVPGLGDAGDLSFGTKEH